MELNAFLQPINSPITQGSFVDGYTFNSLNERGAVTGMFIRDASITNAKIGTAAIGTANIGTLSFNEISGGTATFGGTLNGDGVITVNNAAGSTIVTVNSSGVTVEGGSVTIKNNGGTTILDGTGLVSTANFQAGGTTGSDFSTSNTSYQDITNASVSIVLTRSARVIFFYSARMGGQSPDAGDLALMSLNVGGATAGPEVSNSGYEHTTGVNFNTGGVSFLSTLSAGTTTVKLQGKSNNGGQNATFNQPTLNYVVLGS